jgi:ferredoxin-type protein NapH
VAEDADKLETEEQSAPSEIAGAEEKPEKIPEQPRPSYREMLSHPVGLIVNVRMLRRVVQILFVVAINAYFLAAWSWGGQIIGFMQSIRNILPAWPIIAPAGAPAAVLVGSFDLFEREFTSAAFPFFTLGSMIIVLVVFGRSACGWMCPIGTIQDFATLPHRTKVRPAPSTETELRRVKAYIFIIVMFLAVWVGLSRLAGTSDAVTRALGPFAVAAFDPFNPAYILFVALPSIISRGLWPTGFDNLWYVLQWGWFLPELIFVIVIVAISFWFPRLFCRWLCPAGWIYGIFSKDALIGIGRNPAKCTPDTCNQCEVACPMNIRIRKYPYQHMHSPDCIMCLECKSHCPNHAIVIRFS